jgi:putative tricarboxylic transport membrane protein
MECQYLIRFFVTTITGVCLALVSAAASAQAYPSKSIEFVVHTAPGGGTDLFARVVTDILQKEKILAQPLLVANRTGGGGVIAYNHIKSRRGDPYTVLTVATGTLLTNAARTELGLGLGNYTPLAFFALDPQAVMVAAESKFATYKNVFENRWMNSAQFAAYLAKRQDEMQDFLQSIGLGAKP